MTAKSDHRAPSAPGNGTPTLAGHFAKFAQATALWTGHPFAFLLAMTIVLVWIVTGPIFHYSDTWQLVINTGTTIVTFLMVFLIQNTQNRDTLAIQLKLSELVLAMKGAENKFASIEDLSEEELAELHDECRARAEMTLQHLTSQEEANAHKPRAAAHRAKSARRTAKAVH
jgi:low affinity Fe/Cu permease